MLTNSPALPAQDALANPFNWRDYLAVHPAAELFPLMPEDELRELARDIKTHGLRTPIVTCGAPHPDNKNEALLDGRGRLDALAMSGLLSVNDEGQLCIRRWCSESGRWLDDSEQIRKQYSSEDPFALVLSLNLHRRHLTAESKRELIAKVLKARPELPNLQIASQIKVDDKTVAKIRQGLERRSEIPNVETRIDTKGRKQPSRKSRPIKLLHGEQADPKTVPASAAATKSTANRKSPVSPKDNALVAFNERVLDLVRRIGEHKPMRFVETSVNADDLARVGKFLSDLATLKAEVRQ